MEIAEESVGDVCVVVAQGRLDGSTSAMFAERLDKLVGTRAKLLVDFSGVGFVTSAGLRVLLSIVKKTKAASGALALCGVQASVREILDITGLTPMIEIYPKRAEGLSALSK
jgi:anti-anti-sigma factor